MTLSILHRASGVALAVALLGFVAWLLAASRGTDAYGALLPLLVSVPGKLLMTLSLVALIYHFCNGLRHLAWDMGWGFERADARRSAALVVAVTLVGAALCIYLIFGRSAGAA
jgi:succinate dehydrogenase / fumarate reductase cytochrome b subunit